MCSCEDDNAFAGDVNRLAFLKKGLARFYLETKNIFSPNVNSEESPPPVPDVVKEAPHPGTEGVSFEEALEKCPHLRQQYKDGMHPPIQSDQQNASPSRCPYQNSQSQEWTMRAVVMFVAYNFITLAVQPRYICCHAEMECACCCR